MSAEFKPFYVEHSGPSAMDGRYLVVAIQSASAPTVSEVLVTLVGVNMDNKTMHRLPLDGVKFIGFLGDCLMCDHRKPEEL